MDTLKGLIKPKGDKPIAIIRKKKTPGKIKMPGVTKDLSKGKRGVEIKRRRPALVQRTSKSRPALVYRGGKKVETDKNPYK